MTSSKLSTLDPAKREILLRKPAPLSHPQQRMGLVEQLAPGPPTYNVPTTLRLRGKLDIDALGDTLRALLARHIVLRTVVSRSRRCCTIALAATASRRRSGTARTCWIPTAVSRRSVPQASCTWAESA